MDVLQPDIAPAASAAFAPAPPVSPPRGPSGPSFASSLESQQGGKGLPPDGSLMPLAAAFAFLPSMVPMPPGSAPVRPPPAVTPGVQAPTGTGIAPPTAQAREPEAAVALRGFGPLPPQDALPVAVAGPPGLGGRESASTPTESPVAPAPADSPAPPVAGHAPVPAAPAGGPALPTPPALPIAPAVTTHAAPAPVPAPDPALAAAARAGESVRATPPPPGGRRETLPAPALASSPSPGSPEPFEGAPPTTQPAPAEAGLVRPDAAAATIPAQVPAAGAAQLLAPAREPSPPSAMQIAEPFGSDEWSRALGDRVVVMADRDLTQARIALNPPQLGPIEVRVHVSGDQASVAFTAHSHLTREAIEQALPRLREMLGGQGFVHVDVNVSQHSFSERPQQAPAWQPPSTELPAARPAQAEAPAWRPPTARLDLYA